MENPRTPADLKLERYLASHRIEFTYEPDLERELGVKTEKRPDYLVRTPAGPVVCEVAQLQTRTLTRRFEGQKGVVTLSDREQFGPMRAVLIDKANQLRPLAGRGVPLVIVLANSPDGSDFSLDDDQLQGAIWGNPKVAMTIDKRSGESVGPMRFELRDYGAFCSLQKDGTYANLHPHVTAVVTLHERTHEQDWIERLMARRKVPDSSWAAAIAALSRGRQRDPAGSRSRRGAPGQLSVGRGVRARWRGCRAPAFGLVHRAAGPALRL